jgi:1,5-anhydro-D-fructose reductase (1,5-anhydro-D-mannitol-forming)
LTARPIGWGLVGASDIAGRHMVAAIRSQADSEVVAVASRSEQRAAEFATRNAIPHHYASPAGLLADPAVDAVYVSSDNRLHHEHVLACAAAGKPVLCEKPLALSVAAAAEMVAACEAAGVVLGTNHHLRSAPALQAMRRCVREGAVGEVLAARITHVTRLPEHLHRWRITEPEAGGGPLNDMGTHDFDALRFVLDDKVIEVTGMTANQDFARAGIEDQAMAILLFAGGAMATFHAAYNVGFGGSAFDVHGSAGSLLGRGVLSAAGGGTLWLRDATGEREVEHDAEKNAYEGAVAAFNAAVRGSGQPAATGVDGLRALAIASAVRESARRRRPVAPECGQE